MEKPPETPAESAPATETPAAPEATPAPTAEAPEKTPRTKTPKLRLTAEMKADPTSKKLMRYSALFAALAALCIGFLTYTYYQKKHAHSSAPVEATEEAAPMVSETLQDIHVKLRNEQDLYAEIVVECANRPTCDFLKDHPPQVRDLLIPVLSAVDPDIFSNNEAKQNLRKNLLDRLNTLEEMPGKALQVHFNNFSIEGEVKVESKSNHE